MGTRNRAQRNYGGARFFKAPVRSNQQQVPHQNTGPAKPVLSVEQQIQSREHGLAVAKRRAEQAEIARLVANRDKNPVSTQLQAFADYFNRKIAAQDTAYTSSRLAHFKSAFGLRTDFADWQNSVPRDGSVRSWLPNIFNSILPNTQYGNLVQALTPADFKQLRLEGRFARLI